MGHLVWKSSFKKASSFPNDCGMSSYWSILDLINQEEEMWGGGNGVSLAFEYENMRVS